MSCCGTAAHLAEPAYQRRGHSNPKKRSEGGAVVEGGLPGGGGAPESSWQRRSPWPKSENRRRRGRHNPRCELKAPGALIASSALSPRSGEKIINKNRCSKLHTPRERIPPRRLVRSLCPRLFIFIIGGDDDDDYDALPPQDIHHRALGEVHVTTYVPCLYACKTRRAARA
jgi:hypothetical protein